MYLSLRYLIALKRSQFKDHKSKKSDLVTESYRVASKNIPETGTLKTSTGVSLFSRSGSASRVISGDGGGGVSAAERATLGLARVGSRAALNFAFAFLRRAWRSGEDADLCTELLEESLAALETLPEACLFDESNMSGVWLDVVTRANTFLATVALSSRPAQNMQGTVTVLYK